MTPTMNEIAATPPGQLDERFLRIDWSAFGTMLDAEGHATIPGLLTPAECISLGELYDDEALFRSRIVMERHAYGVGEYKYFAYPLLRSEERRGGNSVHA